MANNRVIGKDNQMPWHLPADLKHFKKITMGKPIIMGRKTYQSIGKALPGRVNIVVSRNSDFQAVDCKQASSLDDALEQVADAQEVMIIGGGTLYSQGLTLANKLYLTFIDLDVAGDTFFPDYTTLELKEISREIHLADETNPYNYQFVEYLIE